MLTRTEGSRLRPGRTRRSGRPFLAVVTLVVAAAASCGLASNAAGRQTTTAPGSVAPIRVVITDGKVAMNPGASAPRGAAALFSLKNDTGATARFALLGHVSKPIAPHGRGGLVVFLLRRGSFVVTIKLSSHHTLREPFVVY
jgi:hypothetical protein